MHISTNTKYYVLILEAAQIFYLFCFGREWWPMQLILHVGLSKYHVDDTENYNLAVDQELFSTNIIKKLQNKSGRERERENDRE